MEYSTVNNLIGEPLYPCATIVVLRLPYRYRCNEKVVQFLYFVGRSIAGETLHRGSQKCGLVWTRNRSGLVKEVAELLPSSHKVHQYLQQQHQVPSLRLLLGLFSSEPVFDIDSRAFT